jgi:coenzyme Q-binding protein COQ10
LIQVKVIRRQLIHIGRNDFLAHASACRTGLAMGTIKIHKRIDHHWADLFDLVTDIEKYPKFVPCCQRTKMISQKAGESGRTVIVSRMTVGVSALHVSYANRTVADREKRQITVNSIDGPLRHLKAVWKFDPHGEAATDVEFAVSYEFSSPMLAVLAANIFDAMFNQILEAFEERADRLFRGDKRAAKPIPRLADTAGFAVRTAR